MSGHTRFGALHAAHRASLTVFAHGGPVAAGLVRGEPEDFRVVEELGFEPSGDGEHVLLTVDKRNVNTAGVAARLAAAAGVSARAVGFAGLKDRRAAVRQHFTIHLPGRAGPDWSRLSGDGFRVVAAARHHRKLRRGTLRANRFDILIRQPEGDPELIGQRLVRLRVAGCPNCYGPQRYGWQAGNLRLAWTLLVAGEAVRGRERRGLALSAARSVLFDLVLAERVRLGNWNRLLPGELAMRETSRGLVRCPDPAAGLAASAEQMDLHPTGPLAGAGNNRPGSAARRLEDEVLLRFPELCAGLAAHGVAAARRSLRLTVRELEWAFVPEGLRLGFALRPGGYATSVLREVLQARETRS